MTSRRVADDPVQPTAEAVETITVDGEAVPLRPGESVAACLLAADRPVLGPTRAGGSHRVFCGIGVCFDCLVTVNGVTGIRACLRVAQPGDDVRTTGVAR